MARVERKLDSKERVIQARQNLLLQEGITDWDTYAAAVRVRRLEATAAARENRAQPENPETEAPGAAAGHARSSQEGVSVSRS